MALWICANQPACPLCVHFTFNQYSSVIVKNRWTFCSSTCTSAAGRVLLRYPVQKHERSATAADDWVQKQWPRMTSHKTSEKMEAINNNFMAQLSWPAPPWSRYPQYGSLCRGCGCSCVAAVVKWAAATFNGSLLISSRKLYREWEVERSTSGSCVINLKSGQTADCAQWVTPLQVEL